MIDLLTCLWLFSTSEPAQSTLTARAPQAELAAAADTTHGLTVNLTADFKNFEGEKSILEIPEVLRVRLHPGGLRQPLGFDKSMFISEFDLAMLDGDSEKIHDHPGFARLKAHHRLKPHLL